MLEYSSIAELCQAAEQAGTTISQTALADQSEQMEQPAETLYQRMADSLGVMRDAVRAGMDPELRSTSGLTGGDAAKMARYAEQGGITGTFLNRAMARAIAVSEYNAAMGKVVAAPTAGSCGILPGTIVSMLEEGLCDERAAVMALFTAGAIGMVIAQQASIAGAQGGCQAECGSASAMAAAALWSCAAERRPSPPTPVPWPSRTSWGWCATRWPAWWRSPASSATSPASPSPSPRRRWPWQGSRARSLRTSASRPCGRWATLCPAL